MEHLLLFVPKHMCIVPLFIRVAMLCTHVRLKREARQQEAWAQSWIWPLSNRFRSSGKSATLFNPPPTCFLPPEPTNPHSLTRRKQAPNEDRRQHHPTALHFPRGRLRPPRLGCASLQHRRPARGANLVKPGDRGAPAPRPRGIKTRCRHTRKPSNSSLCVALPSSSALPSNSALPISSAVPCSTTMPQSTTLP